MIKFMEENYPKYGGNGMVSLLEKRFGIKFMPATIIQRARILGLKINKQSSWFEKGATPHNYVDDGSERDTGVQIMIKHNGKWKCKHRVVWEDANGKIPDKYGIIFADGDYHNCELSNLRCLPTKYISMITKAGWLRSGQEIVDLGIAWCELHYAIQDKLR